MHAACRIKFVWTHRMSLKAVQASDYSASSGLFPTYSQKKNSALKKSIFFSLSTIGPDKR